MALVVGDEYRTNELSLYPGGCTVVVEKLNGQILEYPKVKNPTAYMRKLRRSPNVKNAYIKT